MRRSPLLLLPLVLTLTACGPHQKLDLSLRGVSITVPRILTPAKALVPPPLAPLPVPVPVPVLPPLALPEPEPVPTLPPFVPPPPVDTCPKAGQLAVPDDSVTLIVMHAPKPAVYVQSSSGAYTGASKGSLKGTVITTIKTLPTTTSSANQVFENWQVTRVDPATNAVSIELYQLAQPSTSAVATHAGIYLTGLAWKDTVRGTLVFQPAGSGIEVLPLPVTPSGALPFQFASAGTDPNTLTTLALSGNVLGKKRVDVCGKVVDTYTVELSGVLTTPGQQRQITWRQQIATHLDGSEIEDQLGLTEPSSDFTWDRTLRNTTVPKG